MLNALKTGLRYCLIFWVIIVGSPVVLFLVAAVFTIAAFVFFEIFMFIKACCEAVWFLL